MLLRPSPAFEVIDTVDDSSTRAVIVVEVVGYQRWQWRDGQQHNRWGVSGIVSLADVNGVDTVGYGALVHTPIRNTAIGVVWRDGEAGVVLNLDLAKLLQNYGNGDLLSFLQR